MSRRNAPRPPSGDQGHSAGSGVSVVRGHPEGGATDDIGRSATSHDAASTGRSGITSTLVEAYQTPGRSASSLPALQMPARSESRSGASSAGSGRHRAGVAEGLGVRTGAVQLRSRASKAGRGHGAASRADARLDTATRPGGRSRARSRLRGWPGPSSRSLTNVSDDTHSRPRSHLSGRCRRPRRLGPARGSARPPARRARRGPHPEEVGRVRIRRAVPGRPDPRAGRVPLRHPYVERVFCSMLGPHRARRPGATDLTAPRAAPSPPAGLARLTIAGPA